MLSSKQWLLEEDIDPKEGTFVNLLKNPEGYTGYRGPHIWDAIFRENCFSDRFMNLCKEDKTFINLFAKLSKTISYIKYINDTIKCSHRVLFFKYLSLIMVSIICLILVNCCNSSKKIALEM